MNKLVWALGLSLQLCVYGEPIPIDSGVKDGQRSLQHPSKEQGQISPEGKFVPRSSAEVSPDSGKNPPPTTREQAEKSIAKALNVIKIDENRYRIGVVELNKQTQTISFPAKVEKRSGPIEYALVTSQGKVHESLLSTSASPSDVHMAALLLGLKPQAPVPDSRGGIKTPKNAGIRVVVSWRKHGPDAEYPLASLIKSPPFDAERKAVSSADATPVPLEKQIWCYNGSSFNRGRFLAQQEGSFIAVMSDGNALINNTLPSRQRDDLFTPNEKHLPASGFPVTVKLTLAK